MGRPATETNGSKTSMTPSAKPLNEEKFAGRWEKFEAGVKGILDFSQYIRNLEDSADKANKLDSILRSKDAEISSFRASRERMIEGFGEKYTNWRDKETRLVEGMRSAEKQVKSLQSQLAASKEKSVSSEIHNQKIKETEDEASRKMDVVLKQKANDSQYFKKVKDAADRKVGNLESELSRKETFLMGVEKRLEGCLREIEVRGVETGLEEVSPDFGEDLMKLSMKFRDLARKHFFTVLPGGSNHDDIFAELKKSGFMTAISKPIPISNTRVSKHLRMAAAESIIVKKIMDTMLQPLCILDPDSRQRLSPALDRLHAENHRQEAILRSLLVISHICDRDGHETNIMDDLNDEIAELLYPLLQDKSQQQAFTADLVDVAHEAFDLWIQTDRSPERIIATTESTTWQWGAYGEDDNAVTLTPAQNAAIPDSGEAVMTLFPQVYSHGGPQPFHKGFALWSDQSVVVAGNWELKEQVSRVNSRNGMMNSPTNGKRRASVSKPARTSPVQYHSSVSSSTPKSAAGGQIGPVTQNTNVNGQQSQAKKS